jgi:hypothetical protein
MYNLLYMPFRFYIFIKKYSDGNYNIHNVQATAKIIFR